mgnify:FL=1
MKREIIWRELKFVGTILLGCTVFSLGFDLFLDPNNINVGGITGIAMILRELLGFGSIGAYFAAINIPLFLLGYKELGRRFFIGSMLGMLFSTVLLDLLTIIPVPKIDLMLAALYGGGLTGLGLGLVFMAGASTGGSDIMAKLLRKRFRRLKLSRLMLILDIITVTLTGVVFHDITRTLYSALPLYVSALVMDSVIYGLDYSSMALIISDKYSEIVAEIARKLERGTTLLDAHGGYHGDSRQVVMCAIRRRQITELKDLVSRIDPNAFMILQDAHQVLGEGFMRYSDTI